MMSPEIATHLPVAARSIFRPFNDAIFPEHAPDPSPADDDGDFPSLVGEADVDVVVSRKKSRDSTHRKVEPPPARPMIDLIEAYRERDLPAIPAHGKVPSIWINGGWQPRKGGSARACGWCSS